ncbi:MAG: histidinol dehydrogenase [Culturomica sp.]|jgi:histidinol dehydrogenase|nr:histidinol dehydrogenase [Culturomica sp.]
MQKIVNPSRETWKELLARPEWKDDELQAVCSEIFAEVRKNGDEALKKYTWFFDRVQIENCCVSEEEFAEAERTMPEALKEAIRTAGGNIREFHVRQQEACAKKAVWEGVEGVCCWQEVRPIDWVGLYIPGGTAPLFSTVLMLGIPAQIAGCRQVVLCTPPGKNGKVEPAILWTARYCGISRVYKAGGIQAIAAMTFGTETVPGVDKIFGPGNQFVTAAKQFATTFRVAIDLPAGPSEVLVVADGSARPEFVAADLLSQAEHGRDSQVVLLTWTPEMVPAVEAELERQLALLPRREVAGAALENSRCILVKDRETALEIANEYAPEHLILCTEDYRSWIPEIRNAGSVFLGNYAPESAGDYASGTNHTLPTNAYAKAYSGVGVSSFTKCISFQEISREGLMRLAPVIEIMAENEQLTAHRNAVRIRREPVEK